MGTTDCILLTKPLAFLLLIARAILQNFAWKDSMTRSRNLMLIGLSHILEMMKRIGSLVRCVFHVRGIFFWMEKRDDFLTEKFRKIFRLTAPLAISFLQKRDDCSSLFCHV